MMLTNLTISYSAKNVERNLGLFSKMVEPVQLIFSVTLVHTMLI